MKANQKGLSLVELMIAITIGLILMTGVVKVFLSSKNTYSNQQALSRVQETGRLAIEFLSKDIRMAGYTGCSSRTGVPPTNTLKTPTAFKFNFAGAIMGYTSNAMPASNGLSPAPLNSPVTDVISVRGAYGTGVEVTQTNSATEVYIKPDATTTETNGCGTTDRVSGFCVNDIVMIADCTKSRVFQITDIPNSGNPIVVKHDSTAAVAPSGNAIAAWWTGSLSTENDVFQPGAELMQAFNTTYYIATGTSGRSSLYQSVNGVTNASELLEGVENMSITYGLDATPAPPATPDYIPESYETAATITAANNWAKVRSVRISVVVASVEDNVLAEAQTFTFNGTTTTDRRLRMVFTTTIGIRSRLI